jgi:hypothetical protein
MTLILAFFLMGIVQEPNPTARNAVNSYLDHIANVVAKKNGQKGAVRFTSSAPDTVWIASQIKNRPMLNRPSARVECAATCILKDADMLFTIEKVEVLGEDVRVTARMGFNRTRRETTWYCDGVAEYTLRRAQDKGRTFELVDTKWLEQC